MSLIILIFVVFLSILLYRMEYQDRSPFLFLWGIMDLLVIMPFIFLRENYNEDVRFYVLLYVAFCKFFYLGTLYILKSRNLKEGKSLEIKKYPLLSYKHTNAFVVICLIGILLLVVSSGMSVNSFMDSTVQTKREMGGLNILFILLISLVAPFLVSFFLNKQWKYFFLVLCVYLFVLVFFRSRSILVFVLLPLGYYVFYWKRNGKKMLLILSILTLLIAVSLKVFRYQGSIANGLNVEFFKEIPKQIEYEFSEGKGDLFVGRVFFNIVRDTNEESNYYGHYTIVRKFIGLFTFNEEKIKTIEYLLFDHYAYFSSGGSLHPTGYGVAYADFKYSLGVLLFVFLAILRVFVHRMIIITRDARLLGVCMYFCLFFARGSVYNSLILLLLVFFIWKIINLIFIRNEK